MTTALVTGGAGFIGGEVTRQLSERGWHVVVVDDFRSSPESETEYRRSAPRNVEVVARSVASMVLPPEEADIVIHLAGPVGPVGVLSQAGSIVLSIVDAAAFVRTWARCFGCPLVYVSTSEVYGGTGGLCEEDQPRVIAAGHSARMEYAVAKLAAETLLLNSDIDVRIVRPFNVAGPRQSARGGFVTPRFVSQAMRGKPLTVYQPGTQVRSFTHVADEADGILRVAEHGRSGGVYNIGNPANRTTMLDYARLVTEVVGGGSVEVVDPTDLHGPDFREAPDKYPAFSPAMADLGWQPTRTLTDIIADTASAMHGDRLSRWGV